MNDMLAKGQFSLGENEAIRLLTARTAGLA